MPGINDQGYLQRFKWDVFLSHGWAGNEDVYAGDRAFMTALQKELELILRERVHKSVQVFLDNQLPYHDIAEDKLREEVRRSATLVAITSPAFCSSDSYCRKELKWFCDGPRPISTRGPKIARRLFRVIRRPVPGDPVRIVDPRNQDPADMVPDVIAGHIPYIFYKPDPQSPGDTIPYNAGGLDQEDGFRKLVSDLSSFLKEQKITQVNNPARTVFLAETTAGIAEGRVRGELLRHEIVSLFPTPALPEREWVRQVEELLEQCDCSIHLVDPDAEHTPPLGWTRSVFERQLISAMSIRRKGFRVFLWCSPAKKVRHPALASLLERARKPSNGGPVRNIKTSLEKFAYDIEPLVLEDPSSEQKPIAKTGAKLVFVQCAERDVDKLMPQFLRMIDWGIEIRTPWFLAPGNSADERSLAQSDSTVIYWGSFGEQLIYQLCDKTIQQLGDASATKGRVLGVDPPDEPIRLTRGHPDFTKIAFPAPPGSKDEQRLKAILLQ
ncbi:hypothetical protein [Tunturiibacter gelidiferens]|uniref:TIR domain-containing protein n=1 Tax=Tunturiibacter gelidiferens TaxID=3069689 RepID=A0AAU7YWW3_9BACT